MRADGVFSGGGVKGIAFGGALRAAGEAGYTEWQRLAGTSAGAITAMVLAVGYNAAGVRAILEDADYAKLADFGGLVGRVRNYLNRGLTRGEALHEWLRGILRAAPRPATTFGDLGEARLRVVGVDLAHSRLMVFPEDVRFYEDEQGRPLSGPDYPIADAVRISAGFPFFFPPLALRDRKTGKEGVLVDGGVSSALPVFLFDAPDPAHPTWAFRLYSGEGREQAPYREIRGLAWPVGMGLGVLDTAMNAFDSRLGLDFGNRTISIPTGDVPTLGFSLTPEQRKFLYDSGHLAATEFFARQPKGENRFGQVPSAQPS